MFDQFIKKSSRCENYEKMQSIPEENILETLEKEDRSIKKNNSIENNNNLNDSVVIKDIEENELNEIYKKISSKSNIYFYERF